MLQWNENKIQDADKVKTTMFDNRMHKDSCSGPY